MTYNPYQEMPLLAAARAVHNGRQESADSNRRQRASRLIDIARTELAARLPIAHVSELLDGVTTETVDIRDSGAVASLRVRGLRLVWTPQDQPRLVNTESQESIDIFESAEDLYAFIYAASIA